jgi:Ser/Thr protein kinase RdoA (MazF antagonist)
VPEPTLYEEIAHLRLKARALLPRYGFSDATSLTLLNETENITFRVEDPSKRAILRFYRHGYHSVEAIRSELSWMTALREAKAPPVPVVLRAADGTELQDVCDDLRGVTRHAAMFGHLPGSEPADADLQNTFRSLGETAASLHQHAGHWERPSHFTRPTWDHETCLNGSKPIWGRWQNGVGLNEDGLGLIGKAGEVISRRLQAFGRSSDQFGLIHSDLRLTNILMDETTINVIDFDDCGFGWHLYDLSAALTFIEDRADIPALEQAWLGGYRTVAPLYQDQLEELPTFHLLRRILIVAWIASHIQSRTAQAQGSAYSAATCAQAYAYLKRFG